MNEFGEVITAMVTPFTENLEVDYGKAGELANHLLENGSDSILVLGTTGEVPTLSKNEKLKLFETVVEQVGDRAPVIAGTGSYSTADSIEMTKKVEEIGVDGILVVVPYYNKPPQDGLYQHYKMIAEETSLPVIIYNVPGRTSRNIEPETISKLAEIDNIIAVKEASGNIAQVAIISRLTEGKDFSILSGDDNMTLPVLSVGGQGVVSVASHLVGNDIKKMIGYFKEGNIEKAIAINKKLGPVFEGIFINTNPIPVKAALNMIGINVGSLRPPLLELDEDKKGELRKILNDLNL